MRAWILTSLLIQLIKSLLDNRTRGSQSPASGAERSSAAILVIVGALNALLPIRLDIGFEAYNEQHVSYTTRAGLITPLV